MMTMKASAPHYGDGDGEHYDDGDGVGDALW